MDDPRYIGPFSDEELRSQEFEAEALIERIGENNGS